MEFTQSQHTQSQQMPGMQMARRSPFTYQTQAGVWDEMIAPDGLVRPHWQAFHRMLCEQGHAGLQGSSDAIARLLRDHGVTYNAYQDTGAAGRPWNLDCVPVLLAPADFRAIENGLTQRMRLFQAMLQDIYGPQQMLQQGWIPPRLLFANPGYLRQVLEISAQANMLGNAATDLVRRPDGSWQALGDRCQMPSGLGYSLENRIIVAQAFAREFKDCRVQRLAGFFEHEREHFRARAPHGKHAPYVVMVTAGPYHRGYFEHAFKARYLGIPLVEGADLTVRDTRLFLKTLEGLRQVDVLVRRIEDRFCDSLELDPDSWSGVPGLLESWRNGKISIVNGIGTSVLDAPAWLPFLPNLCRQLLQEELIIPSVPTWWCGKENERREVLSNPRRWVFKRAYCGADGPAQSAAALSENDLAKLLQQIHANPEQWVAQEPQVLSTAPVWTGTQLAPRAFVMRAFSCGTEEQIQVMPGGLGRVCPDAGGFLVTMNAGALSKDIWVTSDAEVEQKTLLGGQTEQLRVHRAPGEAPSRIADHLFWLGRYAERMEQTVRLLRMLNHRLGGEGTVEQMREIKIGLQLAQEIHLLDQNFDVSSPHAIVQEEVRQLIENPKREGGIPDLLGRLRYNAAAARDRLSDDTWRLFNRLIEDTAAPISQASPSLMRAKLDRIILDLAAFSGMQSENMVQGHGWRFLEIGRRIERGTAITAFSQAAIALSEKDDAVLAPMLEIFDSTMTYRRDHFARPKLRPVLGLLLLHQANPRALAFQLAALQRQVMRLPLGTSIGGEQKSREDVETMQQILQNMSLQDMSAEELIQVCESITASLENFSQHLTEDYFSHIKRRSR